MMTFRRFRIIALLLPLFLCSCIGGDFLSFFSSFHRAAPINRLEKQIDASTGTHYGHTILVFDLLHLAGNKNYTYIGGPQVSNLYLYLTSEDMSEEKFELLIGHLTQKVIVKTQNKQHTQQVLNASATSKIRDIAIMLSGLDKRLKHHKLTHSQVQQSVKKMLAYLHGHDKKLGAIPLDQKLRMLQQINLVLEKLPLTKPLSKYQLTDRYRMRPGSFFKSKKMHSGVDLAGRKSCDVFASASGVVTYAGRMGSYGNLVIVEHAKGVSTYYAHLRKIGVRAGRHVLVGERVGIQGNSGNSRGDHLHYEVRFDRKPVNPEAMRGF